MDLYHIWCNLRPSTTDVAFCDAVEAYLGRLREEGKLEGFRITRRKLGLGPGNLGEFHIMIEIEDLAQLDRAFQAVSRREGPIEELHFGVNTHACDVQFALYRDFPDRHRERGGEKF